MEKKSSLESNAMLQLAAQIRKATYGMCRVGPGPYGFGVCNTNPAQIGILIHASPNPFGDAGELSEDEMIKVTVEGYYKVTPSIHPHEDAVLELSRHGDLATCLVVSAIMKLSEAPLMVSQTEYFTAFNYLLEQDMQNSLGITREEAQELAESGWYYGKEANEIVDFQLYEPLLCMPFHEFQGAVEAVLGRPVMTHEFAQVERLQAEHGAIKQAQTDMQTYADTEMGMTQQMG